MGFFGRLFYPWGLILQVIAIIHFIRRRPDTYWLYIIQFLGPVGALVYIFAEMAPDASLLNQSFKGLRGASGSRRSSWRFATIPPPATTKSWASC